MDRVKTPSARNGEPGWPLPSSCCGRMRMDVHLFVLPAGRPSANGMIRCVEGEEATKGSGQYIAHRGTMSAMLMFFRKDGIESYTCTPWGQNLDPKSPHHVDQSRDLFSKRVMKPTWFKKEELLQHLASEKVLTVP